MPSELIVNNYFMCFEKDQWKKIAEKLTFEAYTCHDICNSKLY